MTEAQAERIVITTVENPEQAETLAHALLERRLCACVTTLPGRSFYRWQSAEIRCDAEVLLLIKTDQRHLAEIERLFAREHPYDCPEFIALPVDLISERYAAWMSAEMQPANGGNSA